MTTLSRRDALRAGGLLAASVGLSGCGSGTAGGDAPRKDTLCVLNKDVQAVRNYNLFSPSNHAGPVNGLVYEQLVRQNALDGGKVEPWLASGWEFSDGGKTLTFELRRDVRFSDGRPMTADDVFYTLELPLKHDELNASGVGYTSVRKVGPHQVELRFDAPAYQNLPYCVNVRVMPQHIWASQDATKWTNPDPVGTGPYVLESFSTQQTTLRRRNGYWGGRMVPEYVKFLSASEDAAKLLVVAGDLDYATIAWPGGEEHFADRDPDKYIYDPPPAGGSEGVMFNHTKAPWNDVHVRRALSMGMDRRAIADLMNDGQEPMPISDLDGRIYRDWVLPEYADKVQQLDVAGALRELEDGGWTIESGRFVKDGQSYRVSMRFNNDYPAWQIEAAAIVDQWSRHLKLDVQLIAQPGATFSNQVNSGDFDVALWFCGNANGVYISYGGLIDPSRIVPKGEVATANPGRWDDPQTRRLFERMRGTDDHKILLSCAHQLQRIVVEQVPFAPVVNGCIWFAGNRTYWKNWPDNRTSKMRAADSTPDMVMMLRQLQKAED